MQEKAAMKKLFYRAATLVAGSLLAAVGGCPLRDLIPWPVVEYGVPCAFMS